MKIVITTLVIALFFVVLMFCIENMEHQVTVHFLTYDSPPLPVFVVALLAALGGVVLTGLVTLVEGIKLRVRNAQLSRRVRKLEAELDGLRNQALGPLPPAPPSEAAEAQAEPPSAVSPTPYWSPPGS
jgi:uncharacterized integral membrane protein